VSASLFHSLRRDIDRMLCAFGLSHDDVQRTHLGDNDLGGHDEEPDQAPQRELHDGDEEQRDEASVSRLRPQERDEQGGRRVLPLDSVPLVRLAQRAEGDVAAPYVLTTEVDVRGVRVVGGYQRSGLRWRRPPALPGRQDALRPYQGAAGR
jgi:hypothetical protein